MSMIILFSDKTSEDFDVAVDSGLMLPVFAGADAVLFDYRKDVSAAGRSNVRADSKLNLVEERELLVVEAIYKRIDG